MIEDNAGNNVYTLKVYDLDDGKKITDRTPSVGSFNFSFVTDDDRADKRQGYERVNDRIGRLEKLIEDRFAADDVDDEPETFGERLGEIVLNDPGKIPQLIGALTQTLAAIFPPKQVAPIVQMQQPQQPQPIPQVDYGQGYGHLPGNQIIDNRAAIGAAFGTDDDLMLQATQALRTLQKNDPKIIEHLTKLAKMSENDRPAFDYLLQLLDNIPT